MTNFLSTDAGLQLKYGVYDVLVDLSALPWSWKDVYRHLECLKKYGGFSITGSHIFIALPKDLQYQEPFDDIVSGVGHGEVVFRYALEHAAIRRRALLVIFGPVLPSNESVWELWKSIQKDPLLGTAQPRFANPYSDCIIALPRSDLITELLPRSALLHSPEYVITAELIAACTLLNSSVVDLLAADQYIGYETLLGAFLDALVVTRRCGFRNIVVNTSVVSLFCSGFDWFMEDHRVVRSLNTLAYPIVCRSDETKLLARYPDHIQARQVNEKLPIKSLEIAAAGLVTNNKHKYKILLDCRGLSPRHNGTSRCIIGLLDGLACVAQDWEIHLASKLPAFKFHYLKERYPVFLHKTAEIDEVYAAAIVPNQLWSLDAIAELHRHAWAIGVNMLDTIGWDIIYSCNDNVELAWRFLSNYADGISYISDYTRQRFNFRFPVAPGRIEQVVYLSLLCDDYIKSAIQTEVGSDYILLFGNRYDHKNLKPTLATLANAFPYQKFVVLGGEKTSQSNVTIIESGMFSEEYIHTLIAGSRCVIYPSYYEGFGLPVVESLAYGRTVLARRSTLWDEIASNSKLPGKMAVFDTMIGLVELLGRFLAGMPIETLAQGASLDNDNVVTGWRESARQMMRFIERCIENSSASSWIRREYALRDRGF